MNDNTKAALGIVRMWVKANFVRANIEDEPQILQFFLDLDKENQDYAQTKSLKSYNLYKNIVEDFAKIFADAAEELNSIEEE